MNSRRSCTAKCTPAKNKQVISNGFNRSSSQKAQAVPQDNNTQVLTISIKADKTYYWNLGSEVDTQKQQDKAMTLPQMTDAVTKIIRAGNEGGKQTQVFIRGDKTVDYGSVMGAMGGLQKAGVGNVGLITEAP
jgi:biopolymer transport protein TolR